MIRNYLLSSIRSFFRQKSSVIINYLGLVLGFSCIAIICLFVYRELSYDFHHEHAGDIYRITHNERAGEIPGIRHLPTVGPPVGPALKEAFAQVEDAVRFRYSPDHVVRYNDKQFYESKIYYVDPSVFNVFTFPLEAGNPATALALTNSVVITKPIARKYFGQDNALGKTITFDNGTELTITGVLAPIPENIHLKFDFLLPFEAFRVPFGYPVTLDDWGWISFHTYVMLKPGEDPKDLEARLPEFVKVYWPEDRVKRFRMELQPLLEIYLGDLKHEQVAAGNKTYLYVLGGAALLILVIAGFNFTNLFTATSASRAKEIGVRKIIGAKKFSMILQLISESTLIALAAAVTIVLLFPIYLQLISSLGLSLHISLNEYIMGTCCLVIIAVVTGVVAGIYPSLSLSALDHQKLIKGSFKVSATGIIIRRSLVFVQFTISIALLCSIFIISDQMNFLKNKDLGYAKNELLLLRMPGDLLARKFPLLKNRLSQNSNVSMVSVGGGRMDGDNGNVPIYTETTVEGGTPMSIDAVTFNFFKTIGISLVAGREFTEEHPADTLRGVIINQSASREFGWTEGEAIGKKIRVGNIQTDGEVIGVIPDFHFGSLRDAIEPLVISYPRTRLEDIYVRFSTNDIQRLISSLEKDWNEIAPELPFDFVLLNDHLQGLYRSESFFFMLFRFFAIVGVVIACLGMFGLINQDIVYRVKEIGIRKVLGASVTGITLLLLRQFLILIVLANVVAWPFCWIIMKTWLNEFSYRVSINALVFPVAGAAVLLIAVLTVLHKSLKAALMNPAQSLRSD